MFGPSSRNSPKVEVQGPDKKRFALELQIKLLRVQVKHDTDRLLRFVNGMKQKICVFKKRRFFNHNSFRFCQLLHSFEVKRKKYKKKIEAHEETIKYLQEELICVG